ncbi:T9SS type A sorting domain-containing protein [Haliscomenobacter sp.]|uniref:T9SS type A sorting domain-containing protein n=1 Tax=Haliscomenobacter sp. TaxID=2717303 RepID=UPI00359407E5
MKNRLYLKFLSAIFLIAPLLLNAQLKPGVFKKTACNACTGEARLTVNDIEIQNSIRANKFKFTLKMKNAQGVQVEIPQSNIGEAFSHQYISFENVCSGDFVIVAEYLDPRFAGLECTKKEYPEKMTAEGEGNFTVDLVSISNEIIQVSSTANNPTYKWSNGVPGNLVQAEANTSYHVTVTDEVGCTKVGGPYKLPDGCGEGLQYNFESAVVGPKMFTTPGQVLRAQVKPNGSTNFVDADASYTITWKDPAGNVLGTGATLPATFDLYKNFDFLTLEFSNKCKKLNYQYNLLKCGSASPELSTLFKVQSQPSCAELDTKDINGNPIDLKSGSLSLNLSALGIPASNISIKVDGTTYDDQSSITVNNLGAGPHQVEVSIFGTNPQEKCTYNLSPSIAEAAFQIVSSPATKDGDCEFNLYCPTNKARPRFIVPAAREYSVELTSGKKKERNEMCRPMLDCILGDQTFSVNDPRRSRVTAITSWAGILDEVFNALLKDENNGLTPEQKAELRRLCEANTNRDNCTKVVFCPGSLTVIDDTKPNKGFKENGDRVEEGCRIIDCGVGEARKQRSTCDPEIAAIVDIDMPIGKDGTSICKEAPKPPKDQPCSTPEKVTVQKIVDDFVSRSGLFGIELSYKWNNSPPLYELAEALVTQKWDISTIGCREIKFCSSNYTIIALNDILDELASIDYCRPCSTPSEIIPFKDAIKDASIKPLLVQVYQQTQWGQSTPFPTPGVNDGRYACMAVNFCRSEGRLMRIQKLKQQIQNAPVCDPCDGNWKTERLNVIVQKFKAGTLVPVISSDLDRILFYAKDNHTNHDNERCMLVTYCTANFSVINAGEVEKFAREQKCPLGSGSNFDSHDHEESSLDNNEVHNNLSLTGSSEDAEVQVKVFLDTLSSESFLRFAPLISGGGIVPKAITTSAQGNYYYNYSHVDNNLALFADSTLQYEWNSWDANKTFTVYESVAKWEYVLTYSGPEHAWSAPLESDTLLRITHYSVRDSFLYLGGYVSGALRYRGELLNPDYTHERLDGFMMRIGTSGTFQGMNILQHIDTLDGLHFAQGSSGDLLVAGRILGDTLQINDQKISLNSSDLGFVAAIQSSDLAFNLLKTIDLNGATISKFAASSNAQRYALVLSNFDTLLSNGSVQEGNALGLLVYSTSGNLSWFDKFKGNLDPQQLDVAFDLQSGLSLGLTYTGIIQHANDAVFLYSQGKEDIGLIKYDSTGALTWKKSYGGPETETIKAILYDDGVIYFGGNLKGQSYYRQLGGYGFYNTTGAFDRAYVSYVLDSVPSAPTAELLQLGKPNVSNTPSPKNLSKALTLYPNPFSNEVMTEFELELASSVQIVVQNELGNTVQSAVVQGQIGLNRHQLSTQLLPHGIYIIQVVNAERRVIGVGKVVKVKP